MTSKLNPYLSFQNNAREAMEFYRSVFGGKLTMSTFKDFNVSQDPKMENLIMHAELEADNGIKFMAADTPEGMTFNSGDNIRMSLSGENESELKSYFEKLSSGGLIAQPLEKAPWGDTFGMLVDKFGITWFVNIISQKS
jgi:PhnB protein